MLDRLDILFGKQKILMDCYNIKYKDINTKDGQNNIRAVTLHLIEELTEVLHCLKNKPWVKTETVVDIKEIEDELADATHFFIELSILLGVDANQLFENYKKKNDINLNRIKTNY